jgi:hypothetical protein
LKLRFIGMLTPVTLAEGKLGAKGSLDNLLPAFDGDVGLLRSKIGDFCDCCILY